jgi:hypothetical protein
MDAVEYHRDVGRAQLGAGRVCWCFSNSERHQVKPNLSTFAHTPRPYRGLGKDRMR